MSLIMNILNIGNIYSSASKDQNTFDVYGRKKHMKECEKECKRMSLRSYRQCIERCMRKYKDHHDFQEN